MCVCVWVCEHFNVFVLVHVYVCVNGYLFACANQKVTVTQSSAARPPGGSASRSSVLSRRHVSGGHVRAAQNPWPVLPARLASSTRARTTPSPPSSMLRLVHVLFLWCVAVLAYLSLMLVCTCVAGCYACCGVLQRRHNFDPFLKRIIGKRQP